MCITESGFTVRSMSRFRPTQRILGFTETPGGLGQGSFLLAAHRVDATFGTVTVTPVE